MFIYTERDSFPHTFLLLILIRITADPKLSGLQNYRKESCTILLCKINKFWNAYGALRIGLLWFCMYSFLQAIGRLMELHVSLKQSLDKLFALGKFSASYIKTCGSSFKN